MLKSPLAAFVLARLRERSTWVGLVTTLTAGGVALTPGQQDLVATAGAALVGLLLAFTKDPSPK